MRHWCPLHVLVVATALFGVVAPARAQSSGTSESGLTPRQVLLRLTTAAGEGTGVSNIGEVIADLVGLEVSTAPIGSSAGGFTFTFDPVTRSFDRAAPSFGPMFGERAITAGESRAGFGVNYIHTTYDTIDGVNIGDGSLRSVVLFSGNQPSVEGITHLTISTDTMVFFANVALNGWFDVSVAAPYVTLRIDGSHQIADQLAEGGATASGLGDMALRAKVRLYARDQGGVALGLDMRLPTGDPQAMLGAGMTRTLVSGIWSTTAGSLAPHASVGFEFWSNPFQVFDPLQQAAIDAGRHGIVYTAGVEWEAAPVLTVNGEIVGRTIQDGGRLAYRALPLRANPFGLTSASIASVDPRGFHAVAVAGGAKWNFAGTALFTASVLVPINDVGLRDSITPVVGLDWGF